MGLSNYPDGVTESMIPGYYDWEQEVKVKCKHCNYEGDAELTFTPGYGRYADADGTGECPACGEEITATLEAYLPDPEPPERGDWWG